MPTCTMNDSGVDAVNEVNESVVGVQVDFLAVRSILIQSSIESVGTSLVLGKDPAALAGNSHSKLCIYPRPKPVRAHSTVLPS